jgi:hypothetical protein
MFSSEPSKGSGDVDNFHQTKFHHFGLLSTNAEASCQLLVNLGYEVLGPIEDPLQNVCAYWGSHSTLPCVEIISPTATPGPVSNLAKRIQQGVYHLCFEVSDAQTFIERIAGGNRVLQVSPPKRAVLFENRLISFYLVEGFGLVELLEQGAANQDGSAASR